jgi:hypothetical protein
MSSFDRSLEPSNRFNLLQLSGDCQPSFAADISCIAMDQSPRVLPQSTPNCLGNEGNFVCKQSVTLPSFDISTHETTAGQQGQRHSLEHPRPRDPLLRDPPLRDPVEDSLQNQLEGSLQNHLDQPQVRDHSLKQVPRKAEQDISGNSNDFYCTQQVLQLIVPDHLAGLDEFDSLKPLTGVVFSQAVHNVPEDSEELTQPSDSIETSDQSKGIARSSFVQPSDSISDRPKEIARSSFVQPSDSIETSDQLKEIARSLFVQPSDSISDRPKEIARSSFVQPSDSISDSPKEYAHSSFVSVNAFNKEAEEEDKEVRLT